MRAGIAELALFVLGNTALVWLGWRLARRFLPDADPIERALAAVLVGIAAAIGSVQIVGHVGPLTGWTVVAPLALAVGLDGARRMPAARPPPPLPPLPETRVAGAVLAAVALTWVARLAWGPSDFCWDDLAYHAAVPGWWLRHQTLALPPLSYQSYYPFNAELLTLWTMLPLRSDAHAGLATLAWVSLATLAGLRIARITGGSTAIACLVWAAVLASPAVRHVFGRFSATDLALAAGALAAVAFAIDGRPHRAALAGVAAGVAIGTKVSVAPVIAVLVGVFVVRSARARSVTPIVAFLVPLALLGGPWYVRNLVLTGNPLFPAALGPFDGPLDAATQRATTLWAFVARSDDPGAAVALALRSRLNWPLPLGLVGVAGFVSAAVAAWRTRDPRVRGALLVVLVATLLVTLAHPFVPFSGSSNRPSFKLLKTARYTYVPFLLGVSMVPAAFPTAGRWRWAAVAPAALLVWLVAGARWQADLLGAVAVVAAAAALWRYGPSVRAEARVLGPAVAVLVAAAAIHPSLQRATTQHLYRWDRLRPVGIAWQALERLPAGARIATLGPLPGSHTLYYPLLGRRFHHEPVAVNPDGTAIVRLHEAPPHPDGWFAGFQQHRVPGEALLAHLRDARVDYVVVTRWDRDAERPWPWQHRALLAVLPVERRIHANAYDAVWDVRPTR